MLPNPLDNQLARLLVFGRNFILMKHDLITKTEAHISIFLGIINPIAQINRPIPHLPSGLILQIGLDLLEQIHVRFPAQPMPSDIDIEHEHVLVQLRRHNTEPSITLDGPLNIKFRFFKNKMEC